MAHSTRCLRTSPPRIARPAEPAVAAARLAALGWGPDLDEAWERVGTTGTVGRIRRIDRGWSTLAGEAGEQRVRNIGAQVAVGDWVVADDADERVLHVLPRRSAFVLRASFAGAKGQARVVAANVDTAFLIHALTSPPNPRRLERELVLAFDSGARPVVVLSKADLADDPDRRARKVEAVRAVALSVPVHVVSARTGQAVDELRRYSAGHRTVALLGASGVGKSTLVNALVGRDVQRTSEVRASDDRGRHTTSAAELVDLPDGGFLVDTPGLRAVSLWWEGHGIERAFADIFGLMDGCRFRDCKHEHEPGCAVREAIAAGDLDPLRLASLQHLLTEQARIEDEQRARERAADRRGVRKAP